MSRIDTDFIWCFGVQVTKDLFHSGHRKDKIAESHQLVAIVANSYTGSVIYSNEQNSVTYANSAADTKCPNKSQYCMF